jgi:hypothetical protein
VAKDCEMSDSSDEQLCTLLVIDVKYLEVHPRLNGGKTGVIELKLVKLSKIEDVFSQQSLIFKIWGQTASDRYRHILTIGSIVIIDSNRSRRINAGVEDIIQLFGDIIAVSNLLTENIEFIDTIPISKQAMLHEVVVQSFQHLLSLCTSSNQWNLLR